MIAQVTTTGQPDPRLLLASQAAEQYRGNHARDGDRGLANDQTTVDEGQRGTQEPGACGRQKWGPATQQQEKDHHHDGRHLQTELDAVGPVGVRWPVCPGGRSQGEERDERIQAVGRETTRKRFTTPR